MGRGRKWTEADDRELLHLRDDLDLLWDSIANRIPYRTRGALELRYYTVLKHQNKSAKRPHAATSYKPRRMTTRAPVAVSLGRVEGAPEYKPPAPPSPRIMTTATLIADSELRHRIEQQGLTAGWFGDPPPGRSALDQRNASA